MEFAASFLITKSFDFLLLLSGDSKVSFDVYLIEKSLTPIGWAVVITVLIALFFGLIYLTAKIFKKTKTKLK